MKRRQGDRKFQVEGVVQVAFLFKLVCQNGL